MLNYKKLKARITKIGLKYFKKFQKKNQKMYKIKLKIRFFGRKNTLPHAYPFDASYRSTVRFRDISKL